MRSENLEMLISSSTEVPTAAQTNLLESLARTPVLWAVI